MANKKTKEPVKIKDFTGRTSKKYLTPFEKKELELKEVLEDMAYNINVIYDNMESLMTYSTIIANINTALINILIKKKIITSKTLEKEYAKIIKDMKLKEQKLKLQMEDLKSSNSNASVDFSDIDISTLKIS